MRPFQVGWTVAAALVLTWQLMLPPVVGVANNGDFGKVIGYFGMGAPREHEYEFADSKYTFDSAYRFAPGLYSSELLLMPPALALNALLSKDGRFDLRAIGFIHSALFLIAFALFLSLLACLRGWRRWTAAAALLIFSDVAYA